MGRLTRYGNFDVYCDVGYCPKDCNTCEMFKKIRERLAYYEELDTSKKPKYSNWKQDDDDEEFYATKAECRNCGREFEFGTWNDEENHHCECGQRMDWR